MESISSFAEGMAWYEVARACMQNARLDKRFREHGIDPDTIPEIGGTAASNAGYRNVACTFGPDALTDDHYAPLASLAFVACC